jgi:hypothetical protein
MRLNVELFWALAQTIQYVFADHSADDLMQIVHEVICGVIMYNHFLCLEHFLNTLYTSLVEEYQ